MHLANPNKSNSTTPDANVDRTAQLDNLARLSIARAAPVQYDVATSPSSKEATYRLRYQAVMEREWAKPADLPGGLEYEDDDQRAVPIGGWIGEKLVASARMIFPAPGHRLPVEVLYDLVIEPRDRVVQVDRVIVARSHSDSGSRILMGLFARCWLEMRSRGFHIWAGVDSPGMVRLYRRFGFDVTILGEARVYWDEERYPVRFDPISSAAIIQSRHVGIDADLSNRDRIPESVGG